MKSLALVLLFATTVFGQNPYEYVDDALIQKVGQIVYEYDQRIAASRAGGSISNSNSFQQDNIISPARSGGYTPSRMSRSGNYFNQNQRQVAPVAQQQQQQQVYQQRQVTPVVQQTRQSYQRQYTPVMQQQQTRQQRQYTPAVQQQQRVYRQEPQYQQRTQATPYQYQAPSVQRSYEQPQQAKSLGYSLSRPEAIPMIYEFHDVLENGSSGSGGAGADPVRGDNSRRYNYNNNVNSNGGFQLA